MLCLALLLPAGAQARTQKKAASHPAHKSARSGKHPSKRASKVKRTSKSRKSARRRGQQAISAERVREIQAALIREHYLDGEPTGVWDQRSKDAMQRFQGANGWQTKVVPDSRALIKLGLGPDHADLLNPQTAAVATLPGGGAARNPAPQQ